MPTEVLFRRATAGDLRDCHDVMWRSVTEFGVRNGTALQGTADDWWAGMASLHGFLAANAAEWWSNSCMQPLRPRRSVFGYRRQVTPRWGARQARDRRA